MWFEWRFQLLVVQLVPVYFPEKWMAPDGMFLFHAPKPFIRISVQNLHAFIFFIFVIILLKKLTALKKVMIRMLVFCGTLTLDVRIDWTSSCSFTPWKGSYRTISQYTIYMHKGYIQCIFIQICYFY